MPADASIVSERSFLSSAYGFGNANGPWVCGFSGSRNACSGLYFFRYFEMSSGMSSGSTTWVKKKPSMQTITGSKMFLSSAILYDCIIVSTTSWTVSQ